MHTVRAQATGDLPLPLTGTVGFAQCKRRGMHTINNLWCSPGLQQRNYLAIWQTSPDAQEAGGGNSRVGQSGSTLASPTPPARLAASHWKGREPLPLLLGPKEHLQDWNQSKTAVKNEGGVQGRETLIIMTRKNAIKKNKEKGKTDPIWEANEIQIQNRPLRSVCCKAPALGAAFTCQDAVLPGPLVKPLCSVAGLVLPWSIPSCDQHWGRWLDSLCRLTKKLFNNPADTHRENLRSARPNHSTSSFLPQPLITGNFAAGPSLLSRWVIALLCSHRVTHMAALLSFPFSLHTSPSSADHLHHSLHLPT